MPTNKKLSAAHLAILAALIIVPAARGQGVTCDGVCLIMTRYLNAMVNYKAFKGYGGTVHAAEAIFEGQPSGGSSGWN